MTAGKESFQPLSELYRRSEYRKFRAKHRTNRWAEFVGYGPNGKMLGWWDGSDDVIDFDPHEIEWTRLMVYV